MKITKEKLIEWIDRPPSNSDLDFINEILKLKKQKDDVVEYIRKHIQRYDVDGSSANLDEFDILASPNVLLRMLGEIDVED